MAATQVRQLVDMGFHEEDARRALQQVNNNTEQAIERLLTGAFGDGGGGDAPPSTVGRTSQVDAPNEPPLVEDLGFAKEDAPAVALLPPAGLDVGLSTVLEMSMLEREGAAGGSSNMALPEGARENGLPCGLRNIGNTCYVNSLLQTLLHVEVFRARMLRYRAPHAIQKDGELGSRRREHSIRLALELRQLCAYSLFSMRSCIDPSGLLGEFVDDSGQKLEIGTQEDVGEFMLKFMDRLEEGLQVGEFVGLPQSDSDILDDAALDITDVADKVTEPFSADDAPPAGVKHEPVVQALEPTATEEVSEPVPVVGSSAEVVLEPAAEPAEDVPQELRQEAQDQKLPESSNDKTPSPLQALLFGRQVQTLSYREGESAVEQDSGAQSRDEDSLSAPPLPEALVEVPADTAKAGKLVVSEERNDFLHIFLDVRHKNLYSAWEATNLTEVDYTTPSGKSTTARTSIAIERLPKLLFFQLQRVTFDNEKKAQVKVDEAFEFDSTIHADRFLTCNQEKASETSRRVRQLRGRHAELTKALAKFEHYRGRPASGIDEVFGAAAECLEENLLRSSASACASHPVLEQSDPDDVAVNLLQDSELRTAGPTAVRLLKELREACHGRAQELRMEIARLTQDIDDAYSELREHPYELHAIWVHQGIAGSGHYWAYLRDRPNNQWIRFDDAIVSVVGWEELRTEAIGKEGSNTSAYVLVYLDKQLAERQSRADEAALKGMAEVAMPPALLQEIHRDNEKVQVEQKSRSERMAEQQLRQHAEAIFQHYAGLIHKWEPRKRTCDQAGSPLDPAGRKKMFDAALLGFESFLYRQHGEHEVWTYLVEQSINVQRQSRGWRAEDEPIVLFYLGVTLRSQKCYAQMLCDIGDVGSRQCEFISLDNAKLLAQYNVVLTQAHVVDVALTSLRDDRTKLVECIGALGLVWGALEPEDKFRQNEVLLVMSTLIYNVVDVLEKHRRALDEVAMSLFQSTLEYFLLLLHVVEWPKSWKAPVISRILTLCPGASQPRLATPTSSQAQKEAVLQHGITKSQAHWEQYESQKPEPGQEFFDRHRMLYAWAMQDDEEIAREFVFSLAPQLRGSLGARSGKEAA